MIYYGGVPLLLPTQEMLDHFDQYLPLDRIAYACTNFNCFGAWRQKVAGPSPVGVPLINWPEMPKLRLNQLYWPTGASRWALGLFVINLEMYEAIFSGVLGAIASSADASRFLQMADGTNSSFIRMHALQPRWIVKTSASPWPQLGILPLVDDRYWWQFRNVDWDKEWNPALDEPPTWSELFGILEDALGTSISTGDLSADFQRADPVMFGGMYDNPALLLDVAAASVGKRVVVSPGGGVSLLSPAESVGTLSLSQLVAGGNDGVFSPELIGNAHASLPQRVDVVFRKWREGIPSPRGEEYAITKDSRDYGPRNEGVYRSVLTIRSTALADFTEVSEESGAANESELQALAGKLAEVAFGWLAYWYDLSFAGLFSWSINGYDDYVLVSMGAIGPNGEEWAMTEVHSLPPNFAVTEVGHCFQDVLAYWPEARWECTQEGGIGKGSSGTAKLMVADADGVDGELIDSGLEVLLHDPIEIGPTEGTHRGYMRYMSDANRWEMWQRECG